MKEARTSLTEADNDADAMKETLPANFRAEIHIIWAWSTCLMTT